MERARVKKGGGRARFPLWEENPRELSVDYQWELWLRIMSGNYYLAYHDAEKLRFIGILANPKVMIVLVLSKT